MTETSGKETGISRRDLGKAGVYAFFGAVGVGIAGAGDELGGSLLLGGLGFEPLWYRPAPCAESPESCGPNPAAMADTLSCGWRSGS